MDYESAAGDDPPPAYTLLSSTPPPARSASQPESQGSFSRRSRRYLHLVDAQSRPLPPLPPPSPSVSLLVQAAPPTQNRTPSGRAAPAPAHLSSFVPSPSRRLSVTGFLPKLLQTLSRARATKEVPRTAAEEQALAEQKLREMERRDTWDQTQERLRALLSQVFPSEHEFTLVLQSCWEACAAKDINFAAGLQLRILAGNLPVYWAIIKRPAAGMREDGADHGHGDRDALVMAILNLSRPLEIATVHATRHACVTVSDNVLFRRLCRLCQAFSPVPCADRMLLEGSDTADVVVVVREMQSNERAFVASIKLAQFRPRMRLSKQVRVEFVARERMWCLIFSADTFPAEKSGASKSGTRSRVNRPWAITLQLCEHSLPTWVDAQLVIAGNFSAFTGNGESCSSISIPLKSQEQELQHSINCIRVILDKSVTGRDLPDGLSPIVDASGVLRVCINAKLVMPTEPGCVVC